MLVNETVDHPRVCLEILFSLLFNFSHQYASLCDTTTTNQSMNSIGIPYALSNAGLVVGIAMLIFVAYLTDKSLRMIVELANFHPKLRHLGVFTYEDLARIHFVPDFF